MSNGNTRRRRKQEIFEAINKNFPKLMIDTKSQIQEAQSSNQNLYLSIPYSN